ncbi:MAG: hypothetical protein ACFFCV_04260 [Promethearchaeota archaeon]
MIKKNEYPVQSSLSSLKDLSIGDIANLSMLQIIILQILKQYKKPIIRHTLYQEIKDFISGIKRNQVGTQELFAESFQKKKISRLSTSTFYSNLNFLEQQGFLAFNRNKKGKIDTVKTSPLTNVVINFLSEYFLLNLIKDREFDILACEKIIEKIESYQLESKNTVFSVWSHENIELTLINFLLKKFNSVYFLSSEITTEKLVEINLKDINFTKISGGLIREPDNAFDYTFIQGYNENMDFYGLTQVEILKELVRVTKPGGIIFLFIRTSLSKTKHSLVDKVITNKIITLYNNYILKNGKALTKSQLKDILINAGFEKYQIFEEQGALIGIGEVQK